MSKETPEFQVDDLFVIHAPKGTAKIAETPEERLALLNNWYILRFLLKVAIETPEKVKYEIREGSNGVCRLEEV